jgi:hypothetical protein
MAASRLGVNECREMTGLGARCFFRPFLLKANS